MGMYHDFSSSCDRCGVMGTFRTFQDFIQSAWANYPGGLILCPHCAALMKNGYIEKMAQITANEEEYEL